MTAVTVPIVSSWDPRGVNAAQTKLNLLGKETGRTGAMMKTGMLAGVAAVGSLAVALKGAVVAAVEDQKAQALLARTLEVSAGATAAQVAETESWITTTSRAAAVTDDKLRPALGALTRATGDVTKAQQLTALALDISAGSGKSLESVTQALVKAQNGNVGALKKLGVPLDANILKTKDFDAAQKALSETFEGAAATSAQTFSGQMAGLTIELDEAKETIGAAFIPILMKLLPVVSAAARLMAEWAPKIAAVVQVIAEQLEPIVRALWETISAMVKAVKAAIEGDWSEAWTLLKKAAGAALDALVQAVKLIGPILLNLGKGLGSALLDGILAGLGGLKNLLIESLKSAVFGAFDAVKSALGIGSPSKVAAREIGTPIAQGLAAPIGRPAPGAGSSSVNVTVNAGMGADGPDIGRRVVRALRDYQRSNGAVPIRVTG